MATTAQIRQAINNHRDAKLIAVIIEAHAAGIRSTDDTAEIIRHITIDAADVIGCRPCDVDITRRRHLDVLCGALAALVREEIDASSTNLQSAQSSYLKKSR